jgi:hypothetical protein
MKKAVSLIILSMCLVGVGAYLGYERGWHGSFLGNYQIQMDGSKPQNYPLVGWSDVTSGKLQKFLEKEEKFGKLATIPNTVLPVSKFQGSGNGYFQVASIAYIELSDDDVSSGKYVDAAKRPYRFVAFYKTVLNKEPYYLLIQEWRNSDGTVAFIPLLEPVKIATNEKGLTEYYQEVINPETRYYLSPIMGHAERDSCFTLMGKKGTYCDWYFGDKNREDKYWALMADWLKSGKVPSEIIKYPVIFTRSQITNK